MPARLVITTTEPEIAVLFGLARDVSGSRPALRARYNVAPTQVVPAIRATNGARERVDLKWGLIPHWCVTPPRDPHVNARSETVAEKPSFRDAFRSRRCLVPATGFYGWKPGARRKQPYFFRPRDGGVFGCAGIWDGWVGPKGLVETLAVLTMPANELVMPTDPRMLVIMGEEDFAAWLDPNEGPAAALLIGRKPYPAERMECWPVTTRVNSPAEDDPDLIVPVPGPS